MKGAITFDVKLVKKDPVTKLSDYEYYKSQGKEIPKFVLWPSANFYYSCFWDISTRRQKAFEGVNPLLPGTVLDWARSMRLDLSPTDFKVFYEMDVAFVKAWGEGGGGGSEDARELSVDELDSYLRKGRSDG